MRVTFIKPNMGRLEDGPYEDEGRMEPLELGVLAGLTPSDVECVLYDDRVEPIPYDEPTDLVAISVEIFLARRAFEIAAEYRRRGVPVILGGFHPTLNPDECLRYADSVFLGDAESGWGRVLADLRAGRLQRVYRAGSELPQAGGVLPRRDLFEGKGYLPVTLMQFTRGCRYACDFCAIHAYFRGRHMVRRTHEVLREIESQQRKFIFFVDDNLLADHAAAKRFLRQLIPLRIRWVSQASIDMTDDLELMELVADSGCLGNVIGFESINPDSLSQMNKAPNLSGSSGRTRLGWDRYRRQCEVLRQFHLQTWAAFTLGYDGDTLDSIRETYDFAVQNKFCFAAFNILMPYPGTTLYQRLAAEHRLLFDGQWWLHPDYRFNHAAFVPRHMSPDELTQACWECREQWNSLRSVWSRIWDFRTHLSSPVRMAIYLKYNPLFSRESFRKQGMRLGVTGAALQPSFATSAGGDHHGS